jgi:glycosyltransferase involved in cell wall biosynthesis
MPYLFASCDIYAAPSRLEGFGMPQVESGACGKPVIGIKGMGMLDTLVHGETAFLADIAQEIVIREAILDDEAGYQQKHRVVFKDPRTVDYRASIYDISDHLLELMNNPDLCDKMGKAGRDRVVKHFDYRVVASRFVEILQERLGIE